MRTLLTAICPTPPWRVSFVVTDDLAVAAWAAEQRLPSLTYGQGVSHLMLDDVQALVASEGSPLIEEARKRGLKIHIFRVDRQEAVSDTD